MVHIRLDELHLLTTDLDRAHAEVMAEHLIADEGAGGNAETALLERRARLERFRGSVERDDQEVIEHWREASPAAHAAAMIELARYAEQMTVRTGFGKNPNEMFPGFRFERNDGSAQRDRRE